MEESFSRNFAKKKNLEIKFRGELSIDYVTMLSNTTLPNKLEI